MSNFITTDKQARDIKNNEHVTFIELLDKQPPEGYDTIDDSMKFAEYPCSRYICFTKQISNLGRQYTHIPLRYHSGKYLVKESWKAIHKHDYPFDIVGYWYKTENASECAKRLREAGITFGCEDSKWNSPASMPVKAARSELNLKVSVKRVQELTYDEMGFKGMTSDDISDFGKSVTNAFTIKWNKLHAKPRKTKDGKGYECFPYSYNSFHTKELEKDKRYELMWEVWYYKGLPLAVYHNSFVVIMDGKVRKI